MKKQFKILSGTLVLLLLQVAAMAQGNQTYDFSGTWKYEVRDTPYGNFYGNILLKKDGDKYRGEIVNDKGKKFKMEVLRIRGNRLVFASDIEDSDSIISCFFTGDSLRATVEVKGDDFLYKLNAKRSPAPKNK